MAAPEASAAFRVALTFDAEHPDRPAAGGNDDRLLDALEAAGVEATFFVQGRWAEAHPATARRIAEAGHLVGSHGFYHARMQFLSAGGLVHDIERAEATVLEATGVDPRPWFRCPFGGGATDPRVLRALEGAGYGHVGWTANPEDWNEAAGKLPLAEAVVAEVRRAPDDAIVLLHTWPDATHAAIPAIAARLRDAGATLVRVDALATVTPLPGTP